MYFEGANAVGFRNLGQVNVQLNAQGNFLLGPNAQGKTNFLEALSLVTSLRSFRTHVNKAFVQHGGEVAQLFFVIHSGGERYELEIHFQSDQKKVLLDGNPVKRLSEVIGLFPTVVLAAQDMQLVRGGPSLRRRFLDLTLATVLPEYFQMLNRYHQALSQRNALLKRAGSSESLYDIYEGQMAEAAHRINELKGLHFLTFSRAFLDYYGGIAPHTDDQPELVLQTQVNLGEVSDYRELWRGSRQRDSILKSTQKGPHRDDFGLTLNDQPAGEFASEGQQRTLVLSLKLAQFKFYKTMLNKLPVLLADDILGQLDPERAAAFWNALPQEAQVLATGTHLPALDSARAWSVFEVSKGCINEAVSH